MSQNPNRGALISQIHESDLKISMAITGGGSKLIGELLSVPGASNTLLDANIPYSQEALAKYLGTNPESYCSPETSKWMAVCRYFESVRIHENEITAFACTAALATDRIRKGDHRFFTSIQTRNSTKLTQVTLAKGKRSRSEEEEIVVEIGLAELAKIIGVDYSPFGWTLDDQLEELSLEVSEDWSSVFHRESSFCHANEPNLNPPVGVGILPGSFNPLHDGHREMAEKFSRLFSAEVHFELAIQNADKPPLDFLSIHERVQQFEQNNLWITNTPTFVDKAKIFPGNTFIVGVDTIVRIGDEKYYEGKRGLLEALDSIKNSECRFAVFGRSMGSRFLTLSDLGLPAELAELCTEIPESTFRKDISSTQLRNESKLG